DARAPVAVPSWLPATPRSLPCPAGSSPRCAQLCGPASRCQSLLSPLVLEGFGDEVHRLFPLFLVRCAHVRVSFVGLVVDGTAFYFIAAAASGEVTSTSIGMSFR